MLPLNLSDTASTIQDGSSLGFIAAIAGRQCYIQDASDRGLCMPLKAYSYFCMKKKNNLCILLNTGILIIMSLRWKVSGKTTQQNANQFDQDWAG